MLYTYGNIYHQYTPNVSIYTIHGSYGIYKQIFLKIPYLLQDCRNRCSSKILGHLGSLPTVFSSDNSRIETKRITSCNEVISICIFGNLDKLGDAFYISFSMRFFLFRRKMLKHMLKPPDKGPEIDGL